MIDNQSEIVGVTNYVKFLFKFLFLAYFVRPLSLKTIKHQTSTGENIKCSYTVQKKKKTLTRDQTRYWTGYQIWLCISSGTRRELGPDVVLGTEHEPGLG